ncbi:lysostaphin resistance A-like protein [Halobacillus sp. K22]|uniref:CPBP family intramembrane glutamic endopeptidase n=1 Tax=Halobacillus sp. K22 TaxID=3457431 RepID=UPI003FCDC575
MIKNLAIWFSIIIGGIILFIITQIPFQMGLFGGYEGFGLTIIGLLQALLVIPLLYIGLRSLKMSFRKIGVTTQNWKRDSLLGAAVAIGWAIVQFIWIIPSTGGASRDDISEILVMLDTNWVNILWYLPLGIIGGGIVEELYNRGFFIGALAGIFNDSKVVLYIAAAFSILFFAAGHLPGDLVEWIDLLVPSTAYTVLYLYTKRLTASMVAHGLWNTLVVIIVTIIYS